MPRSTRALDGVADISGDLRRDVPRDRDGCGCLVVSAALGLAAGAGLVAALAAAPGGEHVDDARSGRRLRLRPRSALARPRWRTGSAPARWISASAPGAASVPEVRPTEHFASGTARTALDSVSAEVTKGAGGARCGGSRRRRWRSATTGQCRTWPLGVPFTGTPTRSLCRRHPVGRPRPAVPGQAGRRRLPVLRRAALIAVTCSAGAGTWRGWCRSSAGRRA